jgi:DNA mismatch endonuclease (patch repair protein)
MIHGGGKKADRRNSRRKASKFVPASKAVSDRMRKVKSKNTSLERKTEEILKGMRLKYVKQPKIYGRPDFRIKGTNVIVFCDSSFWHGRRKKDITGMSFSSNKTLWINKLKATKNRDKKINSELCSKGWRVLRFWDDEIIKRPKVIVNKIKDELDEA